MRRRRSRALNPVNYWPGYVDALTNVVLNLLFLIAMFGIALTMLNSQARSARKAAAARAAAAEAGQEGATAPAGAAGLVLAPPPGVSLAGGPVRVIPPLARPAGGKEPPALSPLAPGSGGPQAPGAGLVRPVQALPGPAGTLARSEPSLSGMAVPGDRRDGPGRAGGGYPAAGVPGSPLRFSVVDAYQRRFVPGVQIARSTTESGATLLKVSLAIGGEPIAALQQQGFRTLLSTGLGGGDAVGSGRVKVWTATRLVDPLLRRTAYLALVEVRNQLLALGYPPQAIETRLIEGSAATRDARLIYILAQPASDN